jgi:hypothetical protein
MSDRREYEEAVVLGGILSPALLLALPFLRAPIYMLIAVLICALLLLTTAAGAIWFGRRPSEWRSIQSWRFLTALLLCGAFFFFAVHIANLIGGPWAAALVAGLMTAGIAAATACSGTIEQPQDPAAIDSRLIGQVTAISAALGSLVLGLLGETSVALVVGVLHMVVAIITGLVAINTYRRLQVR